MKIKHSKLRDSGLIFELLIRKITSEAMENKSPKAMDILKKYFFGTELLKEYKIVTILSKPRSTSQERATMIIQTALEAHKKIDKDKLRKEKYGLISEIKANYDIDDFFKAKIDNYKTLASIACLLENNDQARTDDIKDISKFKFNILENIVKNKSENSPDVINEFFEMDSGTRNLVLKTLISKFNSKYKSLDDKQINLLKEYIYNISITPKLKQYVDKELKSTLLEIKNIYPKIEDKIVKIKIKEIVNMSKDIINAKSINENDIQFLLNAFELVKELTNINESS